MVPGLSLQTTKRVYPHTCTFDSAEVWILWEAGLQNFQAPRGKFVHGTWKVCLHNYISEGGSDVGTETID